MENIKTVLLGYISVIGVVLMILLTDAPKDNPHLWLGFNQIYKMSIFFVGVVIAGMAFANFRTKELTTTYLSLPASSIEKTVSQIVLVIFGTIISYTIVFYISHFLFIAIGKAFYTMEIQYFNPFSSENINNISYIIFAQSVFIAGASYFKKKPIFKTSAFVFIIGIIFLTTLSYLLKDILTNVPSNVGLNINYGMSNIELNSTASNFINADDFWSNKITHIFFTYLLAPIFWVITYFNIKEKEV